MRSDGADFEQIFLGNLPMMDVRAPIEFSKGAFPGAVNLPLMDDAERHQVGTCFVQQGQQAAIALGHRLVSGPLKLQRIEAWARFARQHPEGYLYCFRGGLRSQIVQQWLKQEAGIDYPRVSGGYKAMRQFLIEVTEAASQQNDFVVLGGMTGTGKTELIAQLAHGVDLEGLANHRGSSFGARPSGQPTQIAFENQLAIELLRRRSAGHHTLVLEDEGRHIGRCAVPLPLRLRLEKAPLVWLRDALDARVERILQLYVVEACAESMACLGPAAGFEHYAAQLQGSLDKLSRRLGGLRHQQLSVHMQAALRQQREDGKVAGHRAWIESLLKDYYDPMYAYQRQTRAELIVFEGDAAETLAWLRERRGGRAGAA